MEEKPNRNVGARKILYFFAAISHLILFIMNFSSAFARSLTPIFLFFCVCFGADSRCISAFLFILFIIHKSVAVQIFFLFSAFAVRLFVGFCVTTTTVAQSIHRERILSTVFIFPSRSNPPWISSSFYSSSVIDLILLPSQYTHTHIHTTHKDILRWAREEHQLAHNECYICTLSISNSWIVSFQIYRRELLPRTLCTCIYLRYKVNCACKIFRMKMSTEEKDEREK